MKLVTFHNFYVLLFFTFASCAVAKPVRENTLSVDSRLEKLADEFLDTTQNPHLSVFYYADELYLLLQEIPNSDTFKNKLKALLAKEPKNPIAIGIIFLQHKKLFPQSIITKVVKLGKNKLLDIFYKRLTPKPQKNILLKTAAIIATGA